MLRLSIDITAEEHQRLKAFAALRGQSIKDYVLERALGDAPALNGMTETEAIRALVDFLTPRIEQARRGELSPKSMDDIRREALEMQALRDLLQSRCEGSFISADEMDDRMARMLERKRRTPGLDG